MIPSITDLFIIQRPSDEEDILVSMSDLKRYLEEFTVKKYKGCDYYDLDYKVPPNGLVEFINSQDTPVHKLNGVHIDRLLNEEYLND